MKKFPIAVFLLTLTAVSYETYRQHTAVVPLYPCPAPPLGGIGGTINSQNFTMALFQQDNRVGIPDPKKDFVRSRLFSQPKLFLRAQDDDQSTTSQERAKQYREAVAAEQVRDAAREEARTHAFIMQAIMTVLFGCAALFVILAGRFAPTDRHWAYATVGTLLGFWMRAVG